MKVRYEVRKNDDKFQVYSCTLAERWFSNIRDVKCYNYVSEHNTNEEAFEQIEFLERLEL